MSTNQVPEPDSTFSSEPSSSTSAPQQRGTRQGPEASRMQGHWLLARLGKRVLRPGGIGLTRRLLEAAGPTSTDRVIELGPGVGRTAEILLAARPASYKGVDPSPEGRDAGRGRPCRPLPADRRRVRRGRRGQHRPARTSVRTSSWARRC